jgi:hypothetical protein
MKMKVKTPAVELEPGKHAGVIKRVDYRTEPYAYIDVYVKFDAVDYEVKKGYSAVISTSTALGKLLMEAIGAENVTPEAEIDVSEALTGKTVTAVTDLETVNDVKYARILSLHVVQKSLGDLVK